MCYVGRSKSLELSVCLPFAQFHTHFVKISGREVYFSLHFLGFKSYDKKKGRIRDGFEIKKRESRETIRKQKRCKLLIIKQLHRFCISLF